MRAFKHNVVEGVAPALLPWFPESWMIAEYSDHRGVLRWMLPVNAVITALAFTSLAKECDAGILLSFAAYMFAFAIRGFVVRRVRMTAGVARAPHCTRWASRLNGWLGCTALALIGIGYLSFDEDLATPLLTTTGGVMVVRAAARAITLVRPYRPAR